MKNIINWAIVKNSNSGVKAACQNINKPFFNKDPSIYQIGESGDLFDRSVSFSYIDTVFSAIARANIHQFYIKTSHPLRMGEYLNHHNRLPIFGEMLVTSHDELDWPLVNLQLGISKECADLISVAELHSCPANAYFLAGSPAQSIYPVVPLPKHESAERGSAVAARHGVQLHMNSVAVPHAFVQAGLRPA